MMLVTGAIETYAVSAVNGLASGMLYYTMAAGVSLLFGMMNVLNLAQGVLYVIGSYLAVTLVSDGGSWTSWLVAALAVVAVGAAAGGGLAGMMRPVADGAFLNQALLTLGVAYCASALIPVVFGEGVYSVAPPSGLDGTVSLFGENYPVYRLALIGVGLLLALSVTLIVERTPVGALVRATVADREMLRALGVDVRKVSAAVFVIAGSLAMFGGLLGAPILGAAQGLDWQVLILALAVVVVGGLGSVKGALVGALLIGEINTLGTTAAPQYSAFILFGVMVLVLIVRPAGLFGDAEAVRTA